MKLILTEFGTANLEGPSGRVMWSSDKDQDFKDEFSQEFLGEEDADDILEFLVDQGHIDDDDYDDIEVLVESLDGGDETDEIDED